LSYFHYSQLYFCLHDWTNVMHQDAHARLRDPARLTALQDLRLLDTPAEEPFDRLTRLAARVLRAPVALITLVDEHRQFFKSAFGLPEPWASRRETLLTHSFCKHVVMRASLLAVEDSRADPRVRENGAVKDLNVVAYLGAPLTLRDGVVVGSFCVADTQPRRWTADDQQTIIDLAASVMSEILLRMRSDQTRPGTWTPIVVVTGRESVVQTLHAIREGGMAAVHRHGNENPSPLASGPTSESVHGIAPHALSPSIVEQRARLTKRQAEVFDLLLHGLQTKEIARQLNLSHRTIEAHRAMILERLHVSSISNLLKQMLAGPDGL
jgi:DNA-binding NarL/FixJ family response regulator